MGFWELKRFKYEGEGDYVATTNLSEFTPEQRATFLEQARLAKEAKKEAGSTLRQEWADSKLWEWLRAKAKVKAPPYYIPATESKYVGRTLKKIEKDIDWWKEHFCKNVSQWNEWNPNVPAYVLQGLILEAAFPELVAKYKGDSDDTISD